MHEIKVVPKTTEDVTKWPVKLSDAIREGGRGKVQAKVYLATEEGAVCALGAAFVGLAGRMPTNDADDAEDYEALRDVVLARCHINIETAQCTFPLTGKPLDLQTAIWELNDVHGWSFDAIADWLESEGY